MMTIHTIHTYVGGCGSLQLNDIHQTDQCKHMLRHGKTFCPMLKTITHMLHSVDNYLWQRIVLLVRIKRKCWWRTNRRG